jgi:hypothetical protein
VSTPHDHHYVPVFYLNEWAASGKLVAYSRPYGEVFLKKVGARATGYERDLYSFNDLSPDIAQFLESVFLPRNDFISSKALKKLLTGDKTPWTSELRSSWSRFLLGFLIRHPDPFKELRELARTRWLAFDSVTEAEYARVRGPDDPATFQEYLVAAPQGLADKIRIRLLQSVMDNAPLGRRLNAMIWDTIDVSASDDSLLTSDWPLDKNLPPSNGYVALPISPTHLFIAVYERSVLGHLKRLPPKRLVHTCNKETVSRARRFVWARDAKQTEFVRKHMSTRMVAPPFFPTMTEV